MRSQSRSARADGSPSPPGARRGGRAGDPPHPALPRTALGRRIKLAAYQCIRWTVIALLRLLVGFTVVGARRMPRRGPVILVSNHLHNFDPIVLGAAVPRPVFYMAKRELFQHPAFRWLLRNFGGFPVNRAAIDRAALRQVAALLDAGLVVGVFPEGTRSVTGALNQVHSGVALLALQSGAPILPIGVTGTEDLPLDAKAARRPRRRRRSRVRVVVGEPFTLPPRRPGEKQDLAALTERIMLEVAALLPPAYRGAYADQVPPAESKA